MAGSNLWIKTSISLPRHPKTRRAAQLLGISTAELIGRLVMIWSAALEFYSDGVYPSGDELCRAAAWPLEDKERLLDALARAGEPARAGFIEFDHMPGETEVIDMIYLHDWTDYSGTLENVRKRYSSSKSSDKKREDKIREDKEKTRQKPTPALEGRKDAEPRIIFDIMSKLVDQNQNQ